MCFLIAMAISFETKTSATGDLEEQLAWLSTNCFCGASVAALLVAARMPGTYVAFISPLPYYISRSMAVGRRRLECLSQLGIYVDDRLWRWRLTKDQITTGIAEFKRTPLVWQKPLV
jgi:hypothetical protein